MNEEKKELLSDIFWVMKEISSRSETIIEETGVISKYAGCMNSDSPEAFKYYRFVNAENEEEFDAFIERCKELALYDTGVDAEYGDKLITLSTCEYSRANGRLVVVAKRVSECNDLGAENP